MQKSIKILALSSTLDRSEDGNLLCIKHRPHKSLLSMLQAVRVKAKELDSFKCSITEEDMTQENISNLLINEDDGAIDEETEYKHILLPQKISYFK